jgi:hypothetical protein
MTWSVGAAWSLPAVSRASVATACSGSEILDTTQVDERPNQKFTGRPVETEAGKLAVSRLIVRCGAPDVFG